MYMVWSTAVCLGVQGSELDGPAPGLETWAEELCPSLEATAKAQLT